MTSDHKIFVTTYYFKIDLNYKMSVWSPKKKETIKQSHGGGATRTHQSTTKQRRTWARICS